MKSVGKENIRFSDRMNVESLKVSSDSFVAEGKSK